ncbi:MAG: GDSL-type esterase/lipase family protein [Mucilaginibacter sp.]
MPKYNKWGMLMLALALLLSIKSYPQNNTIKIACIGNSVTYGYGLTNREQECYPAQLQQLLGDKYLVKNFGHSGATLLQKGHNPYVKTTEFAEALSFRPDIAIIHLGLNDTDPRDWPDHQQDFEADYAGLIRKLRDSNPSVKIYVCRLTPIFSGHPRFKSGTRDWYWQIQALIPSIAAANKIGLIDLHEPLYNRPDLFADNLHPDKEGAAIIARTIYGVISGRYGRLKPANVFADHMVLQRQQPIPVYGTANTGTIVTVAFRQQVLKSVADVTGHWKVVFPAMHYGGPFELKVSTHDTTIVLKDILIGDVWLCSGQSNMAFPLRRSAGGKGEIAIANNPLLRLYQYNVLKETDAIAWDTTVLRKVNQLQYFLGTWQTVNAASAADFSAVAYYFGKKISTEEHVPIGLIQVAVGGSPIESWIDRYTMEHDPIMVDVLNNWRKSDFMIKFCRDRADTNLTKAVSPRQRHPYEPCYNYEAGIVTLTGFPIKGAIWYQGESNAHNLELYAHAFPVLVNSWRQQWGSRFPFYFVQLSGIDRPSWPAFRLMQAQLQQTVTNCKMAVSMDMGDSLNVHYTRKKQVGERLARLALRYTYKKNIIAEAPSPLFALQSAGVINVMFPASGHLATRDNQPLTGFELVNVKGERFAAKAELKKNRVLLTVPPGASIQKVYYAMQPFTRANLVDGAGLPVPTFTMNLK